MHVHTWFLCSVTAVLLLASLGSSRAQNVAPDVNAAPNVFEGFVASSSQPAYLAGQLADNSSTTFWVSNGTQPGEGPSREKPEWIQFNFRAPVTAQTLTFGGRSPHGPREGELEVSDDGRTFRPIQTFTGKQNADTTVTFPPTNARFFRLVLFSSFDPSQPTSPRNVQIGELRLSGRDAHNKEISWPPPPPQFAPPPEWSAPGVVDPAALTIDGVYGQCINGQSFQQDALTSFNGWQYCTYYDAARHVCLARRQLPQGAWQILRLEDYSFKGNDAHNTISMGICPNDGTIHLAFDHHGSNLHYRVSQKQVATQPDKVKWNANLFGPVTSTLEEVTKRVTYPLFLQTPKGDLQLFYRFGGSGAGQWWMVDYDAAAGKWHGTRQIDSGDGVFKDQFNESKNRNAYPNGFNYSADGRLHYTWTWRENTQGANHDICYAYSDDGGLTWHNNAGVLVNSGDGKQVISLDSPGIVVVPLNRTWSLMNEQTQAVDSKGRIHVAMWHRREDTTFENKVWTPADSGYYHYWRDEQGHWHTALIPSRVGNRPKLFFDAADNAYLLFTTNRASEQWAHDIYYVEGELCVAKASAASHWTDWAIIHREPTASYLNELLGDTPRFKEEGVLSVFAQHSPRVPRESTPLRVIDIPLSVPQK